MDGGWVMVRENEIRTAEIAVDLPAATDAGLVFIGRISTPWTLGSKRRAKDAWMVRPVASRSLIHGY
jgi:hypothetical protein